MCTDRKFLKPFLGLFLCFLIYSVGSQADIYREKFKVIKQPNTDLLKEASTVRLQTEEGIQTKNPTPSLFVSMLGGIAQPNQLIMTTPGHSVSYTFGQPLGLLTAQFINYLSISEKAKWGLMGSVGYSYSEYTGLEPTALHFVPIQLALAYRPETLFRTKVISPFFTAGPALWNFFQRGIEAYDTSSSYLLATAGAGLSLNLNRLKIFDSRNEGEITLQYQRSIGPANSNADLNGNIIQIGGTIAL